MDGSSNGFTLMEILVATAIMAGIGGVFFSTLRMNQQSWESAQSHLAVSGELRRGMNEMSREIVASESTQVDIPADGAWYPSINFPVPQDLDGDGTVLNGAGVLEWSDPITYTLNGTQVIRRQNNTNDRVVANGVTDLEFRREVASPDIVEMQMTVREATGTGDFPSTGTITTRVRLRN